MAKRTRASTRTISWSEEHDQLVNDIVEKYRDEMLLAEIRTHTSNSGERKSNISGAVYFALRKLMENGSGDD